MSVCNVCQRDPDEWDATVRRLAKERAEALEKYNALAQGLEYLIKYEACINGMVISASPRSYVFVADLRNLLEKVEKL